MKKGLDVLWKKQIKHLGGEIEGKNKNLPITTKGELEVSGAGGGGGHTDEQTMRENSIFLSLGFCKKVGGTYKGGKMMSLLKNLKDYNTNQNKMC